MDPLSDVLSLLKPRSYMSRAFDAGAPWSLSFPYKPGIKCYAVASGECWLVVEGVPDPVHVVAGDCFMLPSGRPFRLASDLSLEPVDAVAVFSAVPLGGIASSAWWVMAGRASATVCTATRATPRRSRASPTSTASMSATPTSTTSAPSQGPRRTTKPARSW